MDEGERRPPWPARCYLWATRRLYNEFAWAYDAVSWLVSLGRWSGWRRQALAFVCGPRVLEIGFGTGELLLEMAGRGWQVVGLERSPAMQRVAAGKMRRRGLWASRLLADAQALPLATASLDAIISTFPAPYILAPATWQEAARALRPSGRLIIAGLFVEVDLATLPGAARPTYAQEMQRITDRLQALAAMAGFALTRHVDDGARWRVPVFVLERRSGDGDEVR